MTHSLTSKLLICTVLLFFKQILITLAVISVSICFISLKCSTSSLADPDEQYWRDPLPWPRAHRFPITPRPRRHWPWRRKFVKPKTTSVPATWTAIPGPEICWNRTKVSRVQDEPGPIVCLRRNVRELMEQLRIVGGLIKRYMAVTVIDACGFEDLTTITSPTTTTAAQTTPTTRMPHTHNFVGRPADERDSKAEAQRGKRSIPTSPGTIFRGCQGRGTIPDGAATHRLCTECAATTRLESDRFPAFINEVVCRDADQQCAATMGLCIQRNLQLPFLRSTGDFQFDASLSSLTGKTVYKEVWIDYTQEIRSCCECQMYTFLYSEISSRDDD